MHFIKGYKFYFYGEEKDYRTNLNFSELSVYYSLCVLIFRNLHDKTNKLNKHHL